MYEFHTRCSVADHYLFFMPVISTTNLWQQALSSKDAAATQGSQEMSQDKSGTQTTLEMATTLTTEAELKAWYLVNNQTLCSQGLSCPMCYIEFTNNMLYNTKCYITQSVI